MAKRRPIKPPATRKRSLDEPSSSLAVPPEVYDRVRRLYFRGRSIRGIASLLGLNYDGLRHFVATVLRPEIQAAGVRKSMEIVEEMRQLREFAWEQLELSAEPLRDVTEKTVQDIAERSGRNKAQAKKLAAAVERIIRTYPNTSGSRWATVIQWCLEHEARMLGHYRQPIMEAPSEFRVAGKSLDQINQEMIQRIIDGVKRTREIAAQQAEYEARQAAYLAARPQPPAQ